ncbi:hypothetical protein Tco_0138204 [Tanacetum coccineum]
MILKMIPALLEPRSNKESPKVEITTKVQPVNINEEEEESAKDDYELKRREKGKHVEESRSTPSPITIRSPRIHCTLISSDTEKLQELMPGRFKQYRSFFDELQGRYGYLSKNLKTRFMPRKKFNVLAQHLKEIMEDSLTTMVDDRVKELTKTQVLVDLSVQNYMSGHILHVHLTQATLVSAQEQQYQLYLSIPLAVRPRYQDNPHDDAHHEGDNSLKRQKTSKHGTYVFGESSYGQDYESEPGLSTLGDEHQYHIDQMQNFLKNYIMWESRKEILVSPHPQRPTLVVQSCQRDPKAFALSLINQDLLRANGSIVSISESDYKNLNKNDIKDMYLLIIKNKVDDYAETGLLWSLSVLFRSIVIWERVHDFQLGVESYQQKVNLTAPTITFPCIEKYKVFSIISEPVYDIIYKNNKKEKRVMRHQEVHKFCDATLKRFLEGLKSYNDDIKHGYATPSLNKEDFEYLQLFEEEIEQRFKHRDQIRQWEMYVNARPLGSRRERPE